MNLPILVSSEPSTTKGTVRLVAREYFSPARESASEYPSVFPGWSSSLYSNNQKSLMPPKEPEGFIPVQLRTTTGITNATSPEWVFWKGTQILQMVSSHPADHFANRPDWQSGPSSELESRMIETTTIKCPKGGYVHLVIELKDWSRRKLEPSEHFRKLLNTCLLKWADDLQQLSVDPSDPFGAASASHFTVPHHGSFPPESQKDLLIEWGKELPAKIEVQLLIRGLKLYLDSDVEKARMIARRAVSKFPESRDLQKILKLLSPSKVVTRTASGVSRKHDFEWIRANQRRHRGQWVAVFDGECLASGKDLHSVRESARKRVNLERVLITFLPKEKLP
jgi:hypothetical protein